MPYTSRPDRKTRNHAGNTSKLRHIRGAGGTQPTGMEGQVSHLVFVADLVAEEVNVRDDTQYQKRLKAAKLPHHRTIGGFDFA